jgi:three-Cys-motif partner protein
MLSDFHKAPKAWAQIKHSILGNYLSLFLGKLGRNPIFYVDGFAGPGRLEDGSEGSPLIAAKLASSPPQRSREGVLHCINVEEDPEVFTNLQESTADFVRMGLVKNYRGRFDERLPDVLRELGGATAFFFIDPFGTEGAELETVKQIASRRGKTEILLRYDDTRVKRLIMWVTNHEESFDDSHRKTSKAFRSRIDQLTDEQAANLVQSALASGEVLDRTALIDGYARLVKTTTSLRFSLSYPIRNPETKGHRYYLVHFCKHPDGYIHMANFMAKVERSIEGTSASDLFGVTKPQMEFMAVNKHLAEQKRNESIETLRNALPNIWIARGWLKGRVQNRDLYAAIADEFGWGVLRSEYLAALRDHVKKGYIQMASSNDDDYTVIH